MNSNIQKAIDCLKIRDVFLRDSTSSMAPNFDPKYIDQNEINSQLKHYVRKGMILSLVEEDKEIKIFQVYVELGSRWVLTEDIKEELEDGEELDIKAKIEATYVVEYYLIEDPGKKALDAFALNNASFHVWPFWREYLISQSNRMNLPKTVLPMVQFAQNEANPQEKENDHSSSEVKD